MVVRGRVGWLESPLLHYDSPTFKRYLIRNDRYINLITSELRQQRVKKNLVNSFDYLIYKPLNWFFITLIRHKGILDGWQGVVFSFFFGGNFAWGGAAGDLMADWLVKVIGSVGTAALLIVTFLAYVIWRFNPSFKLPERKLKPVMPQAVAQKEMSVFDDEYENAYYAPDENLTINEKYATETTDILTNNNRLKKDDGNVVVIMPETEADNDDFNLIEKEPAYQPMVDELVEHKEPFLQELEINEIKPAPKQKRFSRADEEMELEINDTVEDDEEPSVTIEPTIVNQDKPITVRLRITQLVADKLTNFLYFRCINESTLQTRYFTIITDQHITLTDQLFSTAGIKNGAAVNF